jgi:hypothetical protein
MFEMPEDILPKMDEQTPFSVVEFVEVRLPKLQTCHAIVKFH